MKCARLSGKTPKSPSGKPCNEVWPGGTALRRIWAPGAAHIQSTLRISGCGYCISQGDTYEEAVENIKDAIKLHIEDRLAAGEEIPQVSASLSPVEIAV
jgi:hypothetical protein